MKEKRSLIGIDIGGTEIKAILTNTQGDRLYETSLPTNDLPGQDNSAVWKSSVKKLIEELEARAGDAVHAIGISTPGTVDATHSYVLSNGTKMLGIEGHHWSDYLNRQVSVLNDAHAALFAESRLGAGTGFQEVILLTLGTGVGGAIMIHGKIHTGQIGRAGHLGHMSVNTDNRLDIVQTPGSLEDAIGECTIRQRSHGCYESTQRLVEAYGQGDPFATWVWLQSIQTLSRGIISLINILSPECIILGGGITKAGSALISPLHAFMDRYEWRPDGTRTPVVLAQMGNAAGSIGAALFAWEKMQA
ncbi:MAG: ROK family protein [Saprospiraceae bacterium]|nr:ROK family protein [Saprospiraceae bacterium]